MIKTVWLGVFVLILFSCGELPESKPSDWNSRQDFSDKPYKGSLFKKWSEVALIDGIQAREEGYALNLNKSQRWKGSDRVFSANSPVYYVFWAEHVVTVTIDWNYRRDNGIGLACKKVGETILDDNGMYRERIMAGPNEYLVMRISSHKTSASVDTRPDWELGFTVD